MQHLHIMILQDHPELLEQIGWSVVEYINLLAIRADIEPDENLDSIHIGSADLVDRLGQILECAIGQIPESEIEDVCLSCMWYGGNPVERDPCLIH